TGALRPGSTGIDISGSASLVMNNAIIEGYDNGMVYAASGIDYTRITPVITNVRVRNSTGAQRNFDNGIQLSGLELINLNDVEIEGYPNGLIMAYNDSLRVSSTPVITNVRVRNSTGGQRTESTGIMLLGYIEATIDSVQIEEYHTGLEYIMIAPEGNYDRTTPVISNVRVRNSTGALRTEPTGIRVSNVPTLDFNRNIIYVRPDTDGFVLGKGIEILDNTNVEIENSTIYGYSTGLYAPDARSNVSFTNSMIWAPITGGLPTPIEGNVQATNSNISYTGSVYPGGNYNLDPLFKNPAQGDFILKFRSPFRQIPIGAIPYDLELLLETHDHTMHQGWNLMGVPYITRAGQNTPVAIFADDLNPFYVSPYLTSIVQMNSISQFVTPEQPYGRYDMTYTGGYNIPTHIIPPMGYWVRNVQQTAIVDVVGAPDDGEYVITIPPAPGVNNRWFLLANPYEVPIAWNNGITAENGLVPAAYIYDAASSSYPPIQENLGTIPAWGGFFIRALEDGGSVYFDYPSGVAPPQNNAPRSVSDIVVAQNSDQAWSFSIHAKHHDTAARIYLGAHPEASDAYDSLDLVALPDAPFVLPTPLKLSIPNNDWESSPGYYVRDTKALATNTWIWNAILDLSNWDMANDSDGSIHLNANEIVNIPSEYQISLINTLTGESVDPRSQYLSIKLRDLIVESPATDSRAGRSRFNSQIPLQIVVTGLGTQQQGTHAAIISAVNYPNPFNPQTVISYNLGTTNSVSLDIYNIKGQKVKNLVNSTQQAGLHSVIWNGTDKFGSTVASGIYFYRLQAGKHSITKKILLSK
ncbi:MAG: T9SS type A sorting domain-containing protein, partial [Candidatus Cloacimonadaceae bacterium]|nr:T9SS type A sorting domain-containing protein [Candidatus Cloacimonadaceae bacterium]